VGCSSDDDSGDAGDDSTIEASCAAALKKRPSGIASCSKGTERKHLWIQQEPDREVGWSFDLDDSYVDDHLPEYWDCLAEYLRTRGAQVREHGETYLAWMGVTGSYAKVSPALEFRIVQEFELNCKDDACEYCNDLSLADCEQDAFCWVITGDRLDATLDCVELQQPAGCTDAGMCGEAMTWALDPSGNCWEFRDTCQPKGFTDHTWERPAQGTDCTVEFPPELTECE
jgi:hypothetical protein